MGRPDRGWLPVVLAAGIGITGVEITVLYAAGLGSSARWANWMNAWLVVLPALVIGWSFAIVGWLARRRRPGNRVGVLMIAAGCGMLVSGLWMVPLSLVNTAGLVMAPWFIAILVQLLLAFPSGRLSGRADRVLVTAGYLIVLPSNAVLMPVEQTSDIGPPGVHNLLLVHADQALAEVLSAMFGVPIAGLLAATAVLLARRWRRGSRAQRRALSPVLPVGVLFAILTGWRMAFPGAIELLGPLAALVAIPYAFLAGLIRIQFFQMRALSTLMTGLGDGRHGGDLPAAMAAAFDDVRLQVVGWLDGRYVDETGRPVILPAQGRGLAVLPVERDGHRLGAVIVDAAVVSERSQLITGLIGAVALAMDNQRLRAELQVRVLELERSRSHVISASEAQRRQLERDLHDGAQQLLVGLRLRLGLIRQSIATTSPAAADDSGLDDVSVQVDSAMSDLDAALAELRELAHGLHPVLLSTRGLATAVRSLAARAPVPVHVDVRVSQRQPEAIESAAYFVIAEGLTNVAKHAAATDATVRVIEQPVRLVIEVEDNGIGGADPAGPGLRGLVVRVAALDGHVRISASATGGTLLQAQIPLPPDRPAGSL